MEARIPIPLSMAQLRGRQWSKMSVFFSDDSMWCFVTDESLDWGEIANVELEKYKAYSGVDAGIFW